MGRIVDAYEYHSQGLEDTGKLIVFCNENHQDDNAFYLNAALAKVIADKPMNQRSIFMEKYVSEIISACDKELVKDIDILFNPAYKIDALRILENINKSRHFRVEWPGKLEGNKLIYAEPGYEDYRTYSIDNYDIICVK